MTTRYDFDYNWIQLRLQIDHLYRLDRTFCKYVLKCMYLTVTHVDVSNCWSRIHVELKTSLTEETLLNYTASHPATYSYTVVQWETTSL